MYFSLDARFLVYQPPGMKTWAAWDLGAVGPQGATRYAMLAYDDIKSIRYFSNDLAAYWRRNGATMETMLATAARDLAPHAAILRRKNWRAREESNS